MAGRGVLKENSKVLDLVTNNIIDFKNIDLKLR